MRGGLTASCSARSALYATEDPSLGGVQDAGEAGDRHVLQAVRENAKASAGAAMTAALKRPSRRVGTAAAGAPNPSPLCRDATMHAYSDECSLQCAATLEKSGRSLVATSAVKPKMPVLGGRGRTRRSVACRRRDRVPARLQAGSRGHRVEAAHRALPVRAVTGLDQDEEPGQPGDAAGARGQRGPCSLRGW